MTKTLDELKQQVSLTEYTQQTHDLKKVGAGTYRIDPCPVCGGNDHFTINEKGNYFKSFSECCKGGSIIDWFIQVEGMEQNEAIDKLYSLVGQERPRQGETSSFRLNVEETKKTSDQPQSNAQPQPNTSELDYTNCITKWHEDTIGDVESLTALRDFALERGIQIQQLLNNHISIVKDDFGFKRVILPVKKGGKYVWYTGRLLGDHEGQPRFKDVKGVSKDMAVYNIDYLNQEHDEPIFLTESIIDAMNLESLDYKAIALNSTSNFDSFIDSFNKSKAKETFLIGAFDSDAAGNKITQKLIDLGYTALKKPIIKTNSKGEDVTDINDWFMDSVKKAQEASQGDLNDLGIKVSIEAQLKLVGRSDNVESYLDYDFDSELEKLSAYKDKKTGFDNLDKKMNGLHAGLYVIGGVSSVGKTTFVHQLMDQLAEQGDHVLYFSLEQSKLEMVTKSLARTSAKLDYTNAISSISIRKGFKDKALIDAMKKYKQYAGRVSIVEGNFGTNVLTIKNYIERYIQHNGVSPIIAIDYLQIMPAIDPKASDKKRIDDNVTELKRLSRDLAIPIFVISSFNRMNYLTPVSFESFKESGGIEYTADVVWGLELGVISSEEYLKLEKQSDKIMAINKAKAEPIRSINLACLKNRNGSLFNCHFSYDPKFDYYRSNEGLGNFRANKGIGSDDTNIKLEFEEVDIECAGGLVQTVKKKKTF